MLINEKKTICQKFNSLATDAPCRLKFVKMNQVSKKSGKSLLSVRGNSRLKVLTPTTCAIHSPTMQFGYNKNRERFEISPTIKSKREAIKGKIISLEACNP